MPINIASVNANVNTGGVALDAHSLDSLRYAAHVDPNKALLGASKQFEAVFMQMVLKSMRATVPQGGLLGGNSTQMYSQMFDSQLSQTLANRGVGLGDMLATALGRLQAAQSSGTASADAEANDSGSTTATGLANPLGALNGTASALNARVGSKLSGQGGRPSVAPGVSLSPSLGQNLPLASSAARFLPLLQSAYGGGMVPRATWPSANNVKSAFRSAPTAAEAVSPDQGTQPASGSLDPAAGGATGGTAGSAPQAFVNQMMPYARAAAASTGIPAQYIVGQAALESGWGRRQIIGADGTQSYNLFGVKAGPDWNGPTVNVATTEYVSGEPQKSVQTFRAYSSYAQSFNDYAQLIANSPRYSTVVASAMRGNGAAGFAESLQRSGYATDPHYAAKLTQVIGQTLRMVNTPNRSANT